MSRTYKRALIVGCSHGAHICPEARKAIIQFKNEYKPHRVIHLGDFCDTAAFRGGANGTSDMSEPVEPDVDDGLTFLAEIGATDVLMGNHEDRLFRLQYSPNAVIAYAAHQVIECIRKHCVKYKSPMLPWDGVFQSMILGNYKLLHGVMYGENAIRDHAETYGNVIHAHTHRPGVATGRRDDHPVGMCVGTLTNRRSMEYAKARRATLSWGMGFVWGEYNDQLFHPNLCLGPQEAGSPKWRLP